jgi:hypothetical protein
VRKYQARDEAHYRCFGAGPEEATQPGKPGAGARRIMREGPRTVRWRDHEFHFETFKARDAECDQSPVWAVSWHGEFIGTMPRAPEETTKEFELRCIGWLADLIH